VEINEFREELIEAARERQLGETRLDLGLLYEYSDRLTQAEEFSDIIPSAFIGTGARGRKLRIDGYQLDEADSSLRLIICDFSGEDEPESMTRGRAEASFSKVQAFIENVLSNPIHDNPAISDSDASELASILSANQNQISRYRIYLFTDSILSGRITELPEGDVQNIPIEYNIWDVSRLAAVGTSSLGLEELETDLTDFVSGGLPCLPATSTDEYQGYLAVMPGEALAKLFDQYGSKLLEGNVRSYLTARGKINKGIQGTVKAEPEKFFVFNNGITCTATSAKVENTSDGSRLVSIKYLQIVNGGQTTASLHTALRLGRTDLSQIHVQMKLSVVKAEETEKLEDLIERIARYSNSQNKVSEADFFSNHPYHQGLERCSRRIPAPSAQGAQFNTYWFYERARGQYQNSQLHLTPARRKEFLRVNPRSQMFVKTDVAKFENSWMRKPHIVSHGAQKNFADFATYVSSKWGDDGVYFSNDGYFRNVVSRAILFRSVEKLVSGAPWYQAGLPRAQIVTYTIAKLSDLVDQHENGACLDFKEIWDTQGLPQALESFLEKTACEVCAVITEPPAQGMHVGEWAKKEDCWQQVKSLDISLPSAVQRRLVSADEFKAIVRGDRNAGRLDNNINALTTVINLGTSYWAQLGSWVAEHNPVYGRDADLIRLASRHGWLPSDRQAAVLVSLRETFEREGFRADSLDT